MYPVSNEFHEAVKEGNDQKVLLIFDDCVFTDEDICVDTGIEFHDNFNLEEDLSIGQTPSNEISFSLFNDERLLNSYKFGDFLATIGVYLQSTTYTEDGNVLINTNRNQYVGYETHPFIKRNGVALGAQPSFAVKSLLGYDGKVWAFSDDEKYAVYDDSTGNNITSSNKLNSFMKNKSQSWAGRGFYYNKSSRRLMIYSGGTRDIYEFCPLGYFNAERPKAPDVIRIDMTCYDFMQRFEDDMPTAKELGITYPTTISNLFVKLCNYVKLPYKTSEFINSTARIPSEPKDFENVTMREVLKWIAEAAGSNAVIDRDGNVVMKWLTNTSQTYEATDYSDFNPYWYETKKVTKLYNRDTQDVKDHTYGSGKESYLIQDNPLLKGVT